jgi:hypothetical protein
MIVTLHASRAAPHNWVAGADTFDAAWAEIHCVSGGQHRATRVLTFVERSNMRELLALAEQLPTGAEWCLQLRRDGTRSPRLAMAAPRILRAATAAQKRGLKVAVRSVPLCLLGPYTDLALPAVPVDAGGPCAPCAARLQCAAPDPAYLTRFGPSELRARGPVELDAAQLERFAWVFEDMNPASDSAILGRDG